MIQFRIQQSAVSTLVIGALLASQMAATPATTNAKQRLSFRTVKPISAHFKTDKEAAAIEKTLKQLGCTVETGQHEGHVDLTYQCTFWRSLTLRDAKEVDQWNKWLTAKGFAVVRNTPLTDHQETVKYQLNDWRTLHFDKEIDATAHVEMFKMLGCEVTSAKHGEHQDVRFRCSTWQTIGLPNHQEAHAWMTVLKQYGFTTLHAH